MSLDPEIDMLLGRADHDAALGPPVPRDSPPRSRGTGGVGMEIIQGHERPVNVGGVIGGAYDAASRYDKALALWQPGLGSADLDVILEQPYVEARARDTVRNDAYVAGAQTVHKDTIVGDLFMLNAKPSGKALGLDEVWETEFQEEVEIKFELWAESPNNWVDASRMNTLTGLVRLVTGLITVSDEALATAEWMRDGRPFNTAVQMIDLDRLSTPMGMWNNQYMRAGVEINDNAAPVAYHIRTHHPADFGMFTVIPTWMRVPVRKPWGRLQVIHILEQKRVAQNRGISAMVSALKEMRITKKFRDVVLQNAVLNATYAATIESDMPAESVFAQLGGGNLGEAEMAQGLERYATSFLSAIHEYSGSARNLAIDGVKIPHLFPGTKLQLRPAGGSEALGNGFEQSLLRYISSALGVSYAQLSHDYSQTNYSSLRAEINETNKHMRAAKKFGADRFAGAVYRLWLEEAISKGEITAMPRKGKVPSWYEGLNADAYSMCSWIGAGAGQVDELKETQAAIQRILFGLSTWEYEVGRLGKDYRKLFAQIKREQAMRQEMGILQNVGADMAAAAQGAMNNKEPGEGTTSAGASAGGGQ